MEDMTQTELHFVTVRYLPGSTYDGWPIRIEGPLQKTVVEKLNGGKPPPEKDSKNITNMYGNFPVWKLRGTLITTIFQVLGNNEWTMVQCNGSGAGGDKANQTFAEMYVFCRRTPKRLLKL